MTDVYHLITPRLTAGFDRLQRLDRPGHRGTHGPMPRLTADQLAELAEQVDLRGHGGAAFPFARKLRAVWDNSRQGAGQTVVVVNGTEGEPASLKDEVLLTRSPHLVLDGAALAASALKAREIVVGVTGWQAERSVLAAIEERQSKRGRNRGKMRLVRMPDRFISGESGALVRGINGEEPIPPGRKVLAAQRGVGGLPTLVSNAETLAQLAVLAALGPRRYGSVGTSKEPGTVMLTVGGRIVVETPTGVPLTAVLGLCGMGVGQGVLVGGYHGKWLTPEAASTALVSREGLEAVGGVLGAGIVLPLDPDTCPLGEVARVANYLAEESAGQCGPCRLGLPGLALAMSALAAGDVDAIDDVRKTATMLRGRGACGHPDGAIRFALSGLEVFSREILQHADRGTCGRKVKGLLPLPEDEVGARLEVDWSRCDGHGLCAHLVPRLIRLDANGFPVVTGASVPTWLARDARQAVEMCPALALRLQG
jgi:NADH:ubiquinone oxidoreductase subunit F (NADH-binding)/ferredoxin